MSTPQRKEIRSLTLVEGVLTVCNADDITISDDLGLSWQPHPWVYSFTRRSLKCVARCSLSV